MCAVIYSIFTLVLYFSDLILLLKDMKIMACGPFRISLEEHHNIICISQVVSLQSE